MSREIAQLEYSDLDKIQRSDYYLYRYPVKIIIRQIEHVSASEILKMLSYCLEK